MRKSIFCKLLFSLITIISAQNTFAQFEEGKEDITIGTIIGTSIIPNAVATRNYTPVTGEQTHRIKNIITFKINEELTSVYLQSGFSATVNFTLETTSGSATKSLTVNYDKTDGAKYNVRDYLVLPSEEAMAKITVINVVITGASGGWNPLTVLQLENEMRVLRYYALGSTAPTISNYYYLPTWATQDELNVVWTHDPTTYNNMSQVEWSYIEDEAADFYKDNGLMNWDRVFQDNSTRVDVDFGQNNYKIPLLYSDTGQLYFRVRAVLRKNDGSMITGPWSTIWSAAFYGHELSLNWQRNTSFAENGKFKTVIQYFDGSLRSRQTVTKDNTTGNTVVAETIYDLQGRPNIQILPTPTIDNAIKYFADFNRFQGMANNEDPAKYFDLTPAAVQCNKSLPLDITKGNGRYYSANNDWISTETKSKFIPDAEGYAYTETRFMDDATERVRTQGGVGLTHQVNNPDVNGRTHDTRYYYGKPGQQELDALFGTEVGDASHYSKNMVRDANGQMSISYVDMHGRTIATSLAGDPTPGIDSIINPTDYPQASGLLTNQLLTPLTNNINGNSIESISTILSPYNSTYNFTYKLDPSILSQFSCTNQQICFDCKYDLEISIKSEDCGAAPIIRKYQNLQIVPANQACGTSMGFTGPGVNNVKQIDFTEFLTAGSWVVRKTLTINDSLFQIRKDSALKAFLCKTQQSLYDSVYNILYATSGCGLPPGNTSACDSCMNHLGTFDSYRATYLSSIGSDTSNHTLDADINFQYSADSLACANACGAINIELSTLKSLRRQMLNDMMPYGGQYAVPLDSMNVSGTSGPNYNRLEAKYNIFSDKFQTTTRTPYFHLPVTETGATSDYFTEDNEIDYSMEPGANRHTILDTITPPVYTNLFQHSWANSLIYRHPEFTKLQYAEQYLASSYEWLDKVQGTDIYGGIKGAHNKHYDDPLGTTNADPFFVMPGNSTDKTLMSSRINVSADGTSTGLSLWQLANASVLCATADDLHKASCAAALSKTQMDPSITVDSLKDKVWEHFRSLYLGFRNELVLKYIDAHAASPVLSSNDKQTLITVEKKIMVFATAEDIAYQNGVGPIWHQFNLVPPDTTGISNTTGNTGNITDKCVGQRPFWKARLKQCEQLLALLNTETHNDSVTVNNIINSILDGMVSVCHNSQNAQQPYGASNVNPAYVGTPQNFEEVINQVFAANGISTLPGNNYFCNPYTIDYPQPYGKNTQVFIKYSNTIDSCGCARFAALKLEAGADSATFSTMNNFLKINYNDSLTLPLWTGLQGCNAALKDTCLYTWGPANGIEFLNESLDPTPNIICPAPLITSAAYVNPFTTNNVKVIYNTWTFSACSLIIKDSVGTVLNTISITCGSDSVLLSLAACKTYIFVVTGFSKSCGTVSSDPVTLNRPAYCTGCPKPQIYSVVIQYPPSPTTQNVVVNYTTPSGASSCVLKVYAATSGTELYSQSINCTANSTVLYGMAACNKYRFVIKCDIGGSCIQIASDTVRLDSCWHVTCTKIFTPIILPSVVVIPSFLNCGYTKPCITCGKLDTLTMDFRNLYPAYNGVPYMDSTSTDDQAKQNALWARYINYKTGFSKNARDYMAAYKNCHTPPAGSSTTALCSFTKPLNDPGGYVIIDTLPCRAVQTQAEFIAYMLYNQMKDSLIGRFDSLYKAKCFEAKDKEEFYVRYQPKEYHYTLYFYDQAGNLVKTLPPAAVKPNYDATYLASVVTARIASTDVNTNNNEILATNYRYNTLNQVINQKTPDAGTSKFWYDRLGRLAVSQNAKQVSTNNYSYTLYDVLGRITEVGQSTNTTAMTQTISQDATSLTNWINNTSAGTKKQITLTVYDIPYTSVAVTVEGVSALYQQNLRNRVSYSMVFDDENQKLSHPTDGTITNGNSATYYSYDIHGNVDTLLQDYKTGMGTIACGENSGGNRFKKMVYCYDLISGKVNDVAYQPGRPDQFYHRYFYDAENRITSIKTSKDKIYWEQDATYSYYRHGPLSRATIGQNQVQGLDYAYTVQGWLKGVNSTSVGTGEYDMGQDGKIGATNSLVARDAFGFSLNYFTGEYKSISTSVTPFITVPMSLPADPGTGISTGAQLFNGNIGAMTVNIPKLGNPMVYGYRYDQLNRIVRMDAFNGLTNSNNTFSSPARTDDYHEEVSYDPNGNISTYKRNGASANGTQNMDYLTYFYNKDGSGNLQNNKLRHVSDAYGNGNPAAGDIGTQGTDNYTYDEIGNLIGDNAEGITNIAWTVYGKIKTITKTTSTINYAYDAAGNRISKVVTGNGAGTTYYVRDASGNVMSVYQVTNTINNGDLSQTELHLYGSSRLGIYNTGVNVQCITTAESTIFTRGSKFFELSNHLGNVLATITDKKIGHDAGNGTIDYYNPDVVTATDYYPFGMGMPGRKYTNGSGYRYGFNGKENDNEVKGEGNQQDYGMRIYDPRLGRFLSVDPLTDEYPELTPYQFASNRPIDGIDLDGAEYTAAQLNEILNQAKAALGTMISENAIVLHGASNAIVNANTLGITDKLGSWGTDNIDDYSTNYDKSLYLWGRVVGDVAAGLQGLAEVSGGSAAVGGGLAVSGTGVGAAAGLPTAIVGGIVAGHGAGTGAAAAIDLGQTLGQLQQLGAFSTGSSDAGQSAQKTPEQNANNQKKSAHGNSRKSNNPQHGYEVKNKKTGEIVDQGISGQPLNKKGTSPRAQQKIRTKYNNDPNLTQRVTKKNMGPKNGRTARENAGNFEQGRQNAYSKSKKNPTPGTGAPGQKRPKPNM